MSFRNEKVAKLAIDPGEPSREPLPENRVSRIDQHCGGAWPVSDQGQAPQHGVGPTEDEQENPWAAPPCECVVVPGEVCRCKGVKPKKHN